MQTLTVFTPTYNRAYLLPRLYESLCSQTSLEFVWLIIDDGSTDQTKELIEQWRQDDIISIEYKYQDNQGMHGAHNTAYEFCTTDYNVCIDSDDYMPNNGVERILYHLDRLGDNFAGLLGLDADAKAGKIIGDQLPSTSGVKLNELYELHKVTGDKKVVLKTELAQKYPAYPIYKGERFVPLDYLYLLINQDYDFKPINEVFCIVEYQEDGSTKNMLKQYRRHPNGFAFSRISRIKYGKSFKERFKNSIHLISSAIFAKNLGWLLKSDKPFLVILASPFGVLLNLYIRFKTKKSEL